MASNMILFDFVIKILLRRLSSFSSTGENHFLISTTICGGDTFCYQQRRDVVQQKEDHCSINQLDIANEHPAGLWRGAGNERVYQLINMKSLNVTHKTSTKTRMWKLCALRSAEPMAHNFLRLCTRSWLIYLSDREQDICCIRQASNRKLIKVAACVRKRTSKDSLLL